MNKSTDTASCNTALKKTLSTSIFDALPDSAYVREAQLVQSSKRPDSTSLLPFSAPTLWRMVKAGTFPKSTKLSKRVTAWKVGDVRAWLLAREAASAEAKPARTLRRPLRAQVEALLPPVALASSKVAEQSEREQIEGMAVLFDRGDV